MSLTLSKTESTLLLIPNAERIETVSQIFWDNYYVLLYKDTFMALKSNIINKIALPGQKRANLEIY